MSQSNPASRLIARETGYTCFLESLEVIFTAVWHIFPLWKTLQTAEVDQQWKVAKLYRVRAKWVRLVRYLGLKSFEWEITPLLLAEAFCSAASAKVLTPNRFHAFVHSTPETFYCKWSVTSSPSFGRLFLHFQSEQRTFLTLARLSTCVSNSFIFNQTENKGLRIDA